ncbi:hypothetical protein C8R43DRAFT_1131663 [Mycena crocata]|nr:hypothetical protein C8R43DRAFT_1131663 [Mycena crocata]
MCLLHLLSTGNPPKSALHKARLEYPRAPTVPGMALFDTPALSEEEEETGVEVVRSAARRPNLSSESNEFRPCITPEAINGVNLDVENVDLNDSEEIAFSFATPRRPSYT